MVECKKLILWIIVLLILSSVSLASIDLTDGLISYYKLDETTGTVAVDSLNANNGTASDARIFTSEVDGIINTGADFSQGNDIIISSNILSGQYPELSISAVYKPVEWSLSSGGNGQRHIFNLYRASGGSGSFAFSVIQEFENEIRVGINSDDFSQIYETAYTFSTAENDPNEFYHFILTFINGEQKLYIDGTEVWSETKSGSVLETGESYDLNIGNYVDGGDRDVMGIIDEVAIWDRALNSTEIEYLYDIQKDGDETGQYPFSALNWDESFPLSLSNINTKSTSFYFDIFPSSTYDCDFYWNDTLKSSLTNITTGTNHSFTLNLDTGFSGEIESFISCTDNDDSSVYNTTTKTHYYDIEWGYWRHINLSFNTYDGEMKGYIGETFDITVEAECYSPYGNDCGTGSPAIYLDPYEVKKLELEYKFTKLMNLLDWRKRYFNEI